MRHFGRSPDQIGAAGRRSGGHVVKMLVCAWLLLAAAGPRAAMQQVVQIFELPVAGTGQVRSLAPGESHDWHVDVAAAEMLEVAVEPVGMVFGTSDEWPRVTVVGPDGATVDESTGPNVTVGIDIGTRTVVSFMVGRPGRHLIRVVARQAGHPLPYRLRVERRGPAVEADRQRLAIHRLWREGGRLFAQGSREWRLASLEQFAEALALARGLEDHESEAMTLGAIATVWYHLSDPAQASPASARALEIWRRLGRGREEAVTLSDLGVIAYLGYDHPSARSYYEQALPGHRAVGDVAAEATTLVRLGWTYFAAGDMPRVIELNQQAIPLWRQVGDLGGESVSLNDLGRAYVDLGEVSSALDAYQQALATRPSDQNPRGAGIVLMRIGQLYLSVADWPRAFDALQQSLALVRRANDTRSEASVLSNLGAAYSRIGDGGEARRHLEPALDLARKVPIRNVEANSLALLGVEAYLSGELDRSRDYFQQALAIQVAITDVRGQATTLRYLAATQLASRSPREALESITQSLDKSQAAGINASGLATLAAVHAALGDARRANEIFQQALDRARQIRARDQEAAVLALFARFQAEQGLHAEARELLEQGLTLHESLRGLLVDPDQRMSYSSRSVTPYERYIDVLMTMARQSPAGGFEAEAFRTAERARARGLLELLATSGVDVREGVDPALAERERALRWNLNAKAAIQTALLSGRPDQRKLRTLEREISDLSSAWRETTTRIRQQSPVYASLSEPQPLSAAEVGALLDSDTVLLEIAAGETRSWLFAVTASGLETFALPSRQAIEDAARQVRDLLTARQPAAGETARTRQLRIARADVELAESSLALSELVLGPIAGKLAGDWRGRRLAIVATGALEYVPFAALPLPGRSIGNRRTPLIAAHEIVMLPSASSLAFLRRKDARRPAARETIAVFADPVFAADDPRVGRPRPDGPEQLLAGGGANRRAAAGGATTRSLETRALEPFLADGVRGSLARLPFSRAEALAVATQVPRDSLLQATDFDASLALATSGRLSDYRIIHFATHGLINTTRPELSGLALSLVDAQGRSRDGFLRLNTIYNLRLSADLVVLSACQSALGKEVAGEGLVGLTRGFMYAGARGVIASLWQVSDAATAELMKKFYGGMLQQHLSPAAALRAAQLEIARDPRWASPYFWAAFVLQGDWKQ
jgi:CHAT domain-containing protein